MANVPVKTFYYQDELNDDFAGTNIKQKAISADYKFIRESRTFRFSSFFLTYFIAMPILLIRLRLVYGFRIKNRKVLRNVKGEAVFLYGNHTLFADSYIPQAGVTRTRKTLIMANPDATSIKGLKTIVAMLGAIPVPDANANYEATKNFMKALNYHVAQKRVIAIYPEAHIWPYYTGIRPFTSKSFIYPVNYNAPTIAMVTTFKKRRFVKKPRVMVTLSDVFRPQTGVSQSEARQILRDEVYNFMIEKASNPANYEYYRFEKIN